MMANKHFQKALSVGLSLALCAGLVMPSFAATFKDLQGVISKKQAYTYEKDGKTVTGIGYDEGTNTVRLNEEVKYDADKDQKNQTIAIVEDVTIDLNGQKIDGGNHEGSSGTKSAIFDVRSGALTVKDSNKSGGGEITGGGSTRGGVSGDTCKGSGVIVRNKGTFNLESGSITGNGEKGGAGVLVDNNGTFNMSGGSVSNNAGRGVVCYGNGETHANITGGTISGNEGTGIVSGGYWNPTTHKNGEGNVSIENAVIIDNKYSGMEITSRGTVTFKDGNEIHSNTVGSEKCDIYAAKGATLNGIDADQKAPTGKQFDGWYKNGEKYETEGRISENVFLVAELNNAPSSVTGPTGGGTFIDDVAVPLAGLFTRADAIGYLWEQSGEPEWELSDFPDVPEDHQWAVAIGWAQDMGIALPDEEGNFRPDDLVLRSVESLEVSPEGELQEFLDRYAVYAGIVLEPDELFIELAGAWDDVTMGEDAQVIFDEFFAKLEAALAEQAA